MIVISFPMKNPSYPCGAVVRIINFLRSDDQEGEGEVKERKSSGMSFAHTSSLSPRPNLKYPLSPGAQLRRIFANIIIIKSQRGALAVCVLVSICVL